MTNADVRSVYDQSIYDIQMQIAINTFSLMAAAQPSESKGRLSDLADYSFTAAEVFTTRLLVRQSPVKPIQPT